MDESVYSLLFDLGMWIAVLSIIVLVLFGGMVGITSAWRWYQHRCDRSKKLAYSSPRPVPGAFPAQPRLQPHPPAPSPGDLRIVAEIRRGGGREQRVTVAPQAAQRTPVEASAVRRHAPVVVRCRRPLWQEKGWRQEGGAFVGEFSAGGRRWRGMIESPYQGAYTAFIWKPPLDALENHEHRPCFRQNGHGPECFNVHFNSMPRSADHAITTIEAVLEDALSKQRRGRQ